MKALPFNSSLLVIRTSQPSKSQGNALKNKNNVSSYTSNTNNKKVYTLIIYAFNCFVVVVTFVITNRVVFYEFA